MQLEDESGQATTPGRWLSCSVVLPCDICHRVQDGLSEQASEEKWTDQSRFFILHNLETSQVWWCHNLCRHCSEIRQDGAQ